MAIISYVLKSGSTWKSSTILDGTDFSISESANVTDISTDGSRSVGLTVVSGKKATVTVNGVNPALLGTAANIFRVGASGALVLKGQLLGAGDTVSTTMTITCAEAVFTGSSAGVPNEGNSTVNLSFNLYDSNDDYSSFVIS